MFNKDNDKNKLWKIILTSDYTGNSVEFKSIEEANSYLSVNSGIQLVKVICDNKQYNFKIAKSE